MSDRRKKHLRLRVEARRPQGRLPAPSEFKMGTRYHKVLRPQDLHDESTECDTCAICERTDVTDDGEWLDSRTWVCHTCVREAEKEVDASNDE